MPKDTAGTYLLPHYGIEVFRNVYILAGQPLVTQPMLQPTPNQTELRFMVYKSFF